MTSGQMRCLVVDDSNDDRCLVERELRKMGHRTVGVASGTVALEMVRSAAYDVALVDLWMPGLSGADLLRELRRLSPRPRLLVVSGFDDRAHVLEALAAGADGYILKTEIGDRLAPALQDVLAGESPLSSRVAAVLLRHVAPHLPAQPAVARPRARTQDAVSPRRRASTAPPPDGSPPEREAAERVELQLDAPSDPSPSPSSDVDDDPGRFEEEWEI